MIGYVKHFDRNKTISFKVGDNKLFRPGEMGGSGHPRGEKCLL